MDQTTQDWLTVAGLILDVLGFMLLLREWWIAFLSDAALMAHEEQLDRQRKLRAFAATTANDTMRQHMTRAGEMQDDMAIRQARNDRRSAQASRRRWFMASGILIFAGFLLQLIGALPTGIFPT